MRPIVILGIFVADTAFRAPRLPHIGETILGSGFQLGPGGKGSNQSIAAARLGAPVHFITRLGKDAFADMARALWKRDGVNAEVIETRESYTGAAFIYVDDASGDNAIIVAPGAAGLISERDVEAQRRLIERAGVFITQLEQPLAAAAYGLKLARAASVTTILNPAPAATLSDDMLGLCDYITPNETEAEGLTGVKIASRDDANAAADRLLERGVGCALITLGERGVLLRDQNETIHMPAFSIGDVVDTTGAGDAFNAGFAVGLSRGMSRADALRFANAVAGLSVTRRGAAASMPHLADVERVLASAD